MSATSENAEPKARVTRSMRRLNSETESIDLENRPETPTGRMRKKVEEFEAVVSTPKRATRASSATRSLIDEPVASPLRRATRRMSSERPVDSPIRPTRSTRRSNQNLNESEDESVIFVNEQPATPRTQRNTRKTLVKLAEVLEEETEVNVNNKLNASDSSNELELRTRSVSKSPIVLLTRVSLPLSSEKTREEKPEMSLGDELMAADKQYQFNGNKHEVFKLNGDDTNQSIIDEQVEPSKEPEIGSTQATEHPKEAIEIEKSVVESIEENQSERVPLEEKQQEDIQELANDTQKNKEPRKTIEIIENIVIGEQNQETSVNKSTIQDITQSNVEEPMEVDEDIQENVTMSHPADLTDSSIRVEVRLTEIHEVTEYQVNEMMNDFVAEDASIIEPEPKNVSTTVRSVEIEIEKQIEEPSATQNSEKVVSPQKQKSTSWSTSVSRKSDRIDAFEAPQVEQSIKASSKSPQKSSNKVLSSDESDDDDYEHNSLIDDEAEEVGSDEESMTKSERDELEANEIVEDGESLGSQDSNVDELESESENGSNDSFITDDVDIENQYEMNSSEEEIEQVDLERPKRKSRIILESSSDEEEIVEKSSPEKSEKENSESPQSSSANQSAEKSDSEESPVSKKSSSQSPQKSSSEKESSVSPQKSLVAPPSNAIVDVESLIKSKLMRISSRRSLPVRDEEQTQTKSTRNSIPSSWRVDNMNAQEDEPTKEVVNERKRKRQSAVVGAANPKRFKEMSPNETEAFHMDNVEGMAESDSNEKGPSTKKSKKPKEVPGADISKLLDRCEEHLEKFNQEKKVKLALKRKKNEEKKLKKARQEEPNADGSPGSDNKENSVDKKKKKKQKAKKQQLVAEMDAEKEDLATRLSKHQQKLEEKREKKRKKKELLKGSKHTSGDEMAMEVDEPTVEKKKKKAQKVVEVTVGKKVLGETKQKKHHIEQQPVEVAVEKKSNKRRIEDTLPSNDEEVIERPKAKKKLNILQQIEDPWQKSRSHDTHKSARPEEFSVATVTSKLKTLIPKGLDKQHAKKVAKKKAIGKVAEPRISLPRPVWTSAGTFIEESVEPYKFKSTEYKPLNVGSSSTQFRVIPFEAKKTAPKSSKMELLMRNKRRDKTMRNMKNLM